MNCPFYIQSTQMCSRENECKNRIELGGNVYCRTNGEVDKLPSIGKWYEPQKPTIVVGARIERSNLP